MRFRPTSVLLLISTIVLSVRLPAQVKAGDDLIGLWGAEAVFGPQVRGDVVLQRNHERWTVRVGGFEATASQVGDSVTLPLVGAQGTLRVWMIGAEPFGFWIQPGGFNAPYSTPLRFVSAGASAWRAEVRPVEERFPLYMNVSRTADGALRADFRNPAVNWPGRGGWYRLERDGDNVAFILARTNKLQWRQSYDSAQRTIMFDFGGPVALRPRTREQAVGFMPRSPSLPAYDYREPIGRADGWRTAAARDVGVSEMALQSIVRGIAAVDPLSDTMPRVHSLLVARRGRLVLDEYFMGFGPDQPHDLRSASKTMTSVMAGVAMHRGATFDMSTRVGSSAFTVGQLLTHSSGLACNDDDDKSPGNEDTMQSQDVEKDWYKFFMALPTVNKPGTTYHYCSAGINMAGSIVGRATSSWLPLFFDRYIARPMQMTHYGVNLMPTGEAYSGGGMHMLPRDLLKFGQLYLDGGRWNGTRLVSEAWVRQSTARQIDRADGSDDGFAWHRNVLKVGTRSFQTYNAGGNGGQFLFVIPELEMVVVTTAGNYGQYAVWSKLRDQLLPRIMQAALPRARE